MQPPVISRGAFLELAIIAAAARQGQSHRDRQARIRMAVGREPSGDEWSAIHAEAARQDAISAPRRAARQGTDPLVLAKCRRSWTLATRKSERAREAKVAAAMTWCGDWLASKGAARQIAALRKEIGYYGLGIVDAKSVRKKIDRSLPENN